MILQNWQPSAEINTLLARSKFIKEIRKFFYERGILEVETPVLSQYAVTDVHLSVFETNFLAPFSVQSKPLFLTTSPEYHMKRLLAAGSGPIFQLCKVFRNEESGRKHNPEFTMLEWYRPHFDMMRLINEVDDLLQQLLDCPPTEAVTYQFIFKQHVGLDPLTDSTALLAKKAEKAGLQDATDMPRDTLLQFLFSEIVEPQIGQEQPTAVYYFPASQAALAQISSEDHRVAERFEFYYKNLELANGFNELTDGKLQLERFNEDNQQRETLGLPLRPIDGRFISALHAGLMPCAGVAIGVDRLLMIALNKSEISDVISFSIDNA